MPTYYGLIITSFSSDVDPPFNNLVDNLKGGNWSNYAARGMPAAAAHTASIGGPPGSFGASHSNVVFISDP